MKNLPPLSVAAGRKLLRYSVAFIWLWTVISTTVSADEGRSLLRGAGFSGGLVDVLLWGSLAYEVVLFALVLYGRWTRPLCLLQGSTIVFFTAYITYAPALRPLWWHPFAPVGKNVPILGALAMLYAFGDED